MGHRFAAIAFTDAVREMQQQHGSRASYAAMEAGEDYNDRLGEHEAAFITARDSFYMASVGETGWPYVQHRGGPVGFVRVLDQRTIGFADFRGNRQYVSVGNLLRDDRVSLFFMDYPNRARLKLLGRVRLVGLEEQELLARLELDDYRARVERGFVIEVEAFDWNCPQHITPRYTEAEVQARTLPLLERARAVRRVSAPARSPEALGEGPLELVVSGVRQLTPRIRGYELRRADGAALAPIAPGAHLRLPVRLSDGNELLRHYSVHHVTTARDALEIAVLREDGGEGGSRAVHASFDLGLRLRTEPPRSHFPLHHDARPAVLIAGGIGITPLKAMAESLMSRGAAFHLHYAGRSEPEMAFAGELRERLGERLSLYRKADGERLDVTRMLASTAPDAVFYVCGPERLLEEMTTTAAALGIAPERVRIERFSAAIAADAKPVEVELRRSGRRLHVAGDRSILDAVLDAGIAAPFGCRAGNCRSCAVRVLEGEVEHRDSVLTGPERDQGHLMCPCVSRARTPALVLDL